MRQFLDLAKALFFNLVSLRNQDRYFRAKGHLMILAARFGFYERKYFAIVRKCVTPGSDVIDIGANFGAYTDLCARLVGSTGRVYAFDPLPWVSPSLNKLALKHQNIIVCPYALSNVGRKTEITVPYLNWRVPEPALATLSSHASFTDPIRIPVDVRILDEYLDSFRSVSFIKVDVEGTELDVLLGAQKVVAKFQPVIQLEADKIDLSALFHWTTLNRYRVFTLEGARLVRAEGFKNVSTNVYLVSVDKLDGPANFFNSSVC
jgi:FkbM family methyltransferase